MTGRRWLWGVLLAAGCSGLEEPEKVPIGILQVSAQDGDAARPVATFVLAARNEYPDSRLPSNLCQLGDIFSLPVGTVDNLDAGDSIAFTSGLGTTYLYPKLDLAGNQSYSPATALVSLTAGTAVTFQIPGATGGFPAVSFTGLTAPAITQLSAIRSSVSASDSLVVTWMPAGDDSSAVELALQFATETATVVNRHILCQWRDDGRGVIAGSLFSEWNTATIRHIEVSRYRTFELDLPGGGVLAFLATYDLTPEPLP